MCFGGKSISIVIARHRRSGQWMYFTDDEISTSKESLNELVSPNPSIPASDFGLLCASLPLTNCNYSYTFNLN